MASSSKTNSESSYKQHEQHFISLEKRNFNYNTNTTIFIQGIHTQVQSRFLKTYLGKSIGRVRNVQIIRNDEQSNAFVTFYSPQDAHRYIVQI